MKNGIKPKTKSGLLAVKMVGAAVTLMIIMMISINFNFVLRDTIQAFILGISWMILTVAAAAICLKAVIFDKERSLLVLFFLLIILFMSIMSFY